MPKHFCAVCVHDCWTNERKEETRRVRADRQGDRWTDGQRDRRTDGHVLQHRAEAGED